MDRLIEIKVGGNHLWKDNNLAGVQGEGNVTSLRISFDEGWDSYAKSITFFDAKGRNPVKRTLTVDLLEDITESTRVYLCKIPPEPMVHAGRCSFVIEGYVDEQRQRVVETELEVLPARGTEGATDPSDPTPSQAEQLQAQLDSIIDDVKTAAVGAQYAEQAVKYAAEAKASAEEAAESKDTAVASAASASESADRAEHALSQMGTEAAEAAASAAEAKAAQAVAEHSASSAQQSASAAASAAAGIKDSVDAAAESAAQAKESAQGVSTYADEAKASAAAAKTSETNAASSASKAKTSETNAASSASAAASSKSSAESAATRAETAKAAAESASTAAQTAKTAAETAKSGAESAKNAAQTAQTGADSAKTAAQAAQSKAEAAQASAESAKAGAEQAKANAESAAEEAATNAAAEVKSQLAEDVAASQQAKAGAEAAQAAAEKAAEEAQQAAGGDFATPAYVDGKAQQAETNANAYTDQKIDAIPTPDVSAQISTHNSSSSAHADIRQLANSAVEKAGVLSIKDNEWGVDYAPSWYMENKPEQVAAERRSPTTIGLEGRTYCTVMTYTHANNSSYGYPVQVAFVDGVVYVRRANGTSGWRAWEVLATQSDVETYVDEKLEAKAAKIGSATLLASAWTGSGNLYSQVVAISGTTENSQVDLTPSVEQLAVFHEKDLTFVTENEDGVVTVYAIGQKPTNDYTIQVTITEVSV